MKKTYFFLLLYLTSFLLFGQSTNLFCATDIVEENYQKQFPGVVETRAKMELEISRKVKSGEIKLNKPKNGFYEIPIVIHIIHVGEAIGTGINKTDQQIIDWVNYSNAILAGTATGFLGPNNGGTEIPFKMVIAQRDAECNDVLGIVRKNGSVIPGYAQHGLNYNLPNIGSGSASSGASQEDIRNLSRWDAEQYYNVYVVNTIGGTIGNTTLNVGGFAYFPGASPLIDGTFMRASVVGTTSTTFAHEMGHAFGLYHTFEGGESDGSTCPPAEANCDLEGDRVCDTEVIKSLSGAYMNYPTNSDENPCTRDYYKGTQYNVMHYGSSLNRFTPGQRTRAMSMTLAYRSNLLNSNALVTEGENLSINLKPAVCTPIAPQTPLSYAINYIKFGDIDHHPNALNSSVDFYKDYSKLCLGNGHTRIAGNQSTNFTVQTFFNPYVALKVYIDWNNDGKFDEAKELAIQDVYLEEDSMFDYSVLPPANAVKNIPLRMRVVSDHSSASINACQVQYGMIRDYAVTVNETVADCSGISSTIEASSDVNVGTSNQNVNLYATGVEGYQAVQYQWQKSVNTTDQWQNILDANAINASDSPIGEIGDVIYYRLKVRCSLTQQEYYSNVFTYEISPVYCVAGADFENSLYINSVKFGSINNTSTYQNGYSNFASIVTDVVKGNSYDIEVTPGTGYTYNKFIVWIDYNNDGDFDDEGEQISTLTSSYNRLSGKIHIPIDQGTGKRRMRIRLHYDDASSVYYPNFSPCGNSYIGEVEDYTINIVDLGCSGISNELTASISNELPSINQEVLLSVSGVNGFNGVESYWQKSIDGQTWENLSSNVTTNFAQTTSSNYNEQVYYRYYTKCLETQVEKISNVVSYTIIPQYCAGGSQSVSGVYISSFILGDYKKTSTYAFNGYQNHTLDIIEVNTGDELNVEVLPNISYGPNQFFMWVDFNNDGDFDDDGEAIQTVTSQYNQLSGTLKIPSDFGEGLRRVRVRLNYSIGEISNITPCGISTLGEVEDYTIKINDLGCNGIAEEVSANISASHVSPGEEFTLIADGINGNEGVDFYWEKSYDATNWEKIENSKFAQFKQRAEQEIGEKIYYRFYVNCPQFDEPKYSNVVSYELANVNNYCSAGSIVATSVYMTNVSFNKINNSSSSSTDGYHNFTSIKTDVLAGGTYSFTATPNENFGANRFFVWIDYNNDGDFDDEGEYISTLNSQFYGMSGNITIPTDKGYGIRRMRVRLDYNTDVASVNNTPCGESTLGEVEDYSINIIRKETIWDGNSWSNGIPTIEKDAIVIGELNVSTDLVANSITVEQDGKVVVKTGTTLTINQKITNTLTADRFVVEHDANLIQLSGLQNIGDIQVYRNSSSMLRNDMTFWSSPVVRQNVRAFSPETLLNRFWTYDENLDEFAQIFENPINLDPTVYSFEKGKGIAIRVRNTLPTNESTVHAGLFTGNPINGAVEVMVSYQNKGYNMIGNPYASNVDVNTFLTQNSHVNSLYFWTHQYPVGSAQFNENFAAYTLAGGTLTDIETIAVGQGFIVGVNNSNSVVFNNTMRTNDQAIFYKENQDRHRVWLSLAKEDQKMSQILVAYLAQATNEFDHQIDAKVINPGASAIYTIIDQEAYAIQGRALPFDTQDRVALGFEAVQEGEYSIQIEAKDGLFENSQSVYVYDKALDIIHDLVTPYYFKSSIGKFDERFELIYQNRDLGLNDSFTKSNILIYTDANDIVVESMDALISKIEVINLEGQKVWTKDKIQQKSHRLRIPASGVLILHITTEDGKETIKKVLKK